MTCIDHFYCRLLIQVVIRHGGSAVSQYLRQELHGLFESVDKANIPELYAWIKETGGYFKRFRGGALAPWIYSGTDTPEMDLEARATEAFFEVSDRKVLAILLLLNHFAHR